MKKIDELLKNINTIAITGHVRPDGDCIGSSLGLYNYILDNYNGINVDIYLEKPSHEFSYMSHFDDIKNSITEGANYDMLVVFDCGAVDRFAPFSDLMNISKKTVCIDHHMSNTGFADETYVIEDLSSTCELLFSLLDENKITKKCAECIYTGIVTDTGVFKYQATTKDTMNVAGVLMSKGINYTKIIDTAFFMKTFNQTKLCGKAMMDAKLFCNNKVIFSYVDMQTRNTYGLANNEMGVVIDNLRNVEGIEVAMFAYELNENEWKFSLRSCEYVDVSVICRKFGGGGHVRASGCTIFGDIDSSFSKIMDEITQYI